MGITSNKSNNEIIKTEKNIKSEKKGKKEKDKIIPEKERLQIRIYDTDEEATLEIEIYKLIWENKFTILSFSNIAFDLVPKQKEKKFTHIFIKSKNNVLKSYSDELSVPNTLLFYVYLKEGVFITKKLRKLQKIFSKFESKIIKISLVDYSSIKNKYPEYFSMYQIKTQSKLAFDLSSCKINLLKRSEAYSKGKNEILTDEDIDLDDEEQTPTHPRNDELIIQNEINWKINDQIINFLYEIQNDEPYEKIIDFKNLNKKKIYVESDYFNNNHNFNYNNYNYNYNIIINNDNHNNNNNNNIENNIEKNIENNIEKNMEKNIENNNIEKNIEKNIKKNIEKNLDSIKLYNNNNEKNNFENYNEFHYQIKKEKKRKKKKKINNYNKENSSDDEYDEFRYIKMYLKSGIQLDKKKQKKNIEKIVIKCIDFRNPKMYRPLKECINNLMGYKNLIKLAFYNNHVPFPEDRKIWNYITKLINENYRIRWLNLKNSYLSDNTLKYLITALKMKRIRLLDLGGNNLTNNSMKLIDKFLEENKTLKRLYLTKNQISTEGIEMLEHSILQHPNLNTLGFSFLNLSNSGFLIKNLLKNGRIKNLFIKGVKLNIRDYEILTEEIANINCNLTYLDIGFNLLPKSAHNEFIGKFILKNTSLKKLCLDGLNLTLKNYMPIFKSIYKNRTIECYSFNQNEKLPIKGILNFFMKINYIKELSVIPWDNNQNKDKYYSEEEIKWFKIFHKKNPNIKIHGIEFKQKPQI